MVPIALMELVQIVEIALTTVPLMAPLEAAEVLEITMEPMELQEMVLKEVQPQDQDLAKVVGQLMVAMHQHLDLAQAKEAPHLEVEMLQDKAQAVAKDLLQVVMHQLRALVRAQDLLHLMEEMPLGQDQDLVLAKPVEEMEVPLPHQDKALAQLLPMEEVQVDLAKAQAQVHHQEVQPQHQVADLGLPL